MTQTLNIRIYYFSVLSCEPEQPEHKYFTEVKNGCFNGTPIDLEYKASMSLLTDLKFKLLKIIHKQSKSQANEKGGSVEIH